MQKFSSDSVFLCLLVVLWDTRSGGSLDLVGRRMSSGRDTRSGGFPSRICGICTWCVLFRLFFNLSRLACTSVSLEIKVCCCDESSFDFSASEPSFVLQLPTSPSSFSTNSDTVSELPTQKRYLCFRGFFWYLSFRVQGFFWFCFFWYQHLHEFCQQSFLFLLTDSCHSVR